MKRLLSLFLAICTVLPSIALCPMPVFAADAESSSAEISVQPQIPENEPQDILDESVENILTETETLIPLKETLGDCKILQHVDADAFAQANHAFRMPELETMDTYVFQNNDGTRSVYYMTEAVKYTDSLGNIREKDLTLRTETRGYRMAENEFDLFLPFSIADGVTLTYEDYEVKLAPTGGDAPATVQNNAVVYDEYFGAGTSLRYTPMLSGVKEEIILDSYVPDRTFTFVLITDGLFLVEQDGRYVLAEDKEGQNVVLYLGEIVVYDALGKPSLGTISVETIKEGLGYTLTVSADEAFLSDPTTVYPVTVDPNLTIQDTASSAGLVEDATIFSGTPNTNTGSWVYLTAGYTDDTYKIGRVLVRLPGLYNSTVYAGLTASDITSVKFYCYDSTGNASQQVYLFPCTSAWTESTVTWNSFNSAFDGTNMFAANMAPNVYTSYTITSIAKGWKNGTYQATAGFMLANFNESDVSKKKGPFASEHSNQGYRPYVVMTYTEPVEEELSISLNVSSLTLALNDTEILSATTNPSGSVVTWTTSNSYVAHVSPSGIVRAQGIGTSTITASVTLGSTTLTATCYVNVELANGVYYFDSVGEQRRLGLFSDESYTENAFVGAWRLPTDSSADITSNNLFKVTNISGNVYSIRSMLDNKMGWIRYGNSLRCATIGTSNENLNTVSRWLIDTDATGTYIYSYVGSSTPLKNYTITYNSLANSTHFVELQPFSSTNTLQRWRITPYTASVQGVVIKSKVNYLAVGDKHTFTAGVHSPNEDITGQHGFTWTVTNGTGQAVIDASTGVLTAVSPGTVTVSAKYNGYVWSATHDINIILADGIYLLSNRQNGLYADIKDQIMSNGTPIHQWESHKGDTQRWVFTHQSGGYFTIKSLHSDQTDYYLSVNNNSTASNAAIVLRSGMITNDMLWKIEPTSNGAFKLIPQTGETNGYVLATTSSSATNGATLIQGEYVTNTSYRDEWYVKRQAWSIGGEFAIGGGTMNSSMDENSADVTAHAERWEDCGYEAPYHVNPTVGELNENSLTSAVAYFSSHGNQYSISFPNSVILTSSDSNTSPTAVNISYFDLSNTDLYIFDACLTASNMDNSGENLCTRTLAAGAECVIGWTVEIDSIDSYLWTKRLQQRLEKGATVKEAVEYANGFIYAENNAAIKSVRVYGNENLVINPVARYDAAVETIPVENGLSHVPIEYLQYDSTSFVEILRDSVDYFLEAPYFIQKTSTSDNGNCYVVDLIYAGGRTDSDGSIVYDIPLGYGYSVIVNNGTIVSIRECSMEGFSDNENSARASNLANANRKIVSLSQSISELAFELANQELDQIDHICNIVSQNGELRYNYSQDRFYYRICTIYVDSMGCYGLETYHYYLENEVLL